MYLWFHLFYLHLKSMTLLDYSHLCICPYQAFPYSISHLTGASVIRELYCPIPYVR